MPSTPAAAVRISAKPEPDAPEAPQTFPGMISLPKPGQSAATLRVLELSQL